MIVGKKYKNLIIMGAKHYLDAYQIEDYTPQERSRWDTDYIPPPRGRYIWLSIKISWEEIANTTDNYEHPKLVGEQMSLPIGRTGFIRSCAITEERYGITFDLKVEEIER